MRAILIASVTGRASLSEEHFSSRRANGYILSCIGEQNNQGVNMRLLQPRPVGNKRLPRLSAVGLMIASCALATPAAGSYHIESLYSDLSGFAQNIELREDSVDGNITPLAGSIITVRHGDIVKRFVIPTDPPADFPAGGMLLVSTIDDLPPDYVMPGLFLPTDGGTIDLDGLDPWTFEPLPTDGTTKLLRSGATAPATVHSFASGGWVMFFESTNVIEYYAPALDHYFMSGSQPDIDALESGRIPGWVETGYELAALAVPIPQYCCSTYGQVAVPVLPVLHPGAGQFALLLRLR
jgi:hypothetical protein